MYSVGTVFCVDDDGILRVGFPGASRGWKADPAEMEWVEEFKVGDWVRIHPTLTIAKHGLGSVTTGSIGIFYCIRPDNSLLLELSYHPNPWHCEPEEVEPVDPFRISDRVCVKRSVAEPRYAWGGETYHSAARISKIESDSLLIIKILNRPLPWQADPSDMEKVVDFKNTPDWQEILTYFRGSELKNYFTRILEDNLKNVDAGAAKELMAYLVKLQSFLSEVNKYASLANFRITSI